MVHSSSCAPLGSRLAWTTLALLACAALLSMVAGTQPNSLEALKFGEPFKADDSGKRKINDQFDYGGSTEVKKSFIRLTPDRQSKRGYIWSKNTVGVDQAVFVLNFRIHGQGRHWFGDGIGFWMTQARTYENGENHGFTDKFYGVGILLDTFNNVEHRGGHKDLTVQINDGTKSLDDFHDAKKLGCDAAFRYHSKSATFDPVYSYSRMKVKIVGKSLTIEIDPKGEGKWTSCFSEDLPFSNDWLRQTTIGITASTGSLADNHDILKFAAFDDPESYGLSMGDAEVWSHNYSKDFDKLITSSVCDQSCKIVILKKFIDNFQMETEHWFEELKEQTQNTVRKLRDKQAQNQVKIKALTDRMAAMVDRNVGAKMADVHNQMNQEIAENVEGKLATVQGGWRMPFFVIVVLLAGVFFFAYQKYQKLVKSHLL